MAASQPAPSVREFRLGVRDRGGEALRFGTEVFVRARPVGDRLLVLAHGSRKAYGFLLPLVSLLDSGA